MAQPHFFVLVVATMALLAQSASAWSFLWRDDEGLATIEAGLEKTSCKVIDHGKHQPYEWDPKDGHFCIQLFHDKKCQRRAGYSCNRWPHDSSTDLHSFKVNGTLTTDDDIWKSTTTEPPASTTTSSLTTSAIKDPPPPTDSSTSLPQSSADDKSNDESLSGGAIAGIVIGIVAVIVLVVIAWLLFRRRRETVPQEPSPAGYSTSGSVPPVSESGGTTATTTTAVGSAPPIAKWGAPPRGAPPTSPTSPVSPEGETLSPAPAYSPRPQEGPKAAAELSNSHQIVELEGSDPNPRHEKSAN